MAWKKKLCMLSAVLICTCALVVHTEAQAPPGPTELTTANAEPAAALLHADRALRPVKVDEEEEDAKIDGVLMRQSMSFDELLEFYGLEFPATEQSRGALTLELDGLRQGGDTCAAATPITGLPFNATGTTIAYADDYDEVCPYSGSTSPDVVYSYTPTSDITVDVTLCAGATAYDTKLYVYENACASPYFACNDDACVSGAGQSYVSELLALSLTGGNTYYFVIDGYGGDSGFYEIDMVEATPPPPPPQCPADAIFGQDPHLPTESWSFATSDAGSAEDYLVYDNFTGLTAQICDIHFWGLDLMYSAGWFECTEDPALFEVKFYTDAAGYPGTEVCSYTISASPTPTGLLYSGYEMNAYAADLTPCCALTDGWVSIQGTGGDPTCWLLWGSSGTGLDGHSYQWDGTALVDRLYDQALCLTGVYVPTFGACCDDATGTCTDNVEIINCLPPLRFSANTLCADLAPGCGLGACCDPVWGGCLDNKLESDCDAVYGPGNWYAGATCAENPCPPACCTTLIAPDPVTPYFEDFEGGLGDWTNSTDDDFDWTRDSGGTTSSGTGPSVDHTTGTSAGYYMYTESSSPNYPNKTAILDGPCFDLSALTTPELTFWYHMYGATMGELNVEVTTDCVNWTTLWTLSGDQGDQWFPGLIDLSAYSGMIKLRFRGVTASSFTSDMAIDDISVMESGGPVPGACCFDDGSCQELSSGDCAAAGGNFLGAFTSCTPNPCPQPCTDNCEDTFPYVENFDSWTTCSTSCGAPCAVPAPWENDDSDDIDWTTDANGTPSSSTGPSGDHTTGSGNYMYVESSSGCYNSTAILVGPCVDLTTLANPALYFWYHMYGQSMGSLYVEITTDDTVECVNWTTVWSLSGDQGNNWYPAVIDLSAYGSESVRFRFRGVTSDNFYGDMAIDDVMVDEGPAIGACCTGDTCIDTFEMSCDGLFAGDNTLCDGTGGSDCNGNGVIDDCDLYNETSTDCNENGIPDECEGLPDCNGDGIPDICDPDCQPNGVSDVCEVFFGSSLDCQFDGIPDECQVGDAVRTGVIYDNGPLITNPGAGAGGADVSALQTAIGGNIYGYGAQVSAGNRVADDVTFEGAAQIDTITFFAYQTGSTTASTITGVTLRIWDGPPNAGGSVIWGDETTNVMIQTDWSGIYRTLDTDLLASNRPIMANVVAVGTTLDAGTYWLDFNFDGSLTSGPWAPPVTYLGLPGTGNALQYLPASGWVPLDDDLWQDDAPFIITGSVGGDCNNNGIPDVCDVPPLCDPGQPGYPAVCSLDCNGNLTPDECEDDCNGNGVPDDCDIAEGTSPDCNENGLPDECDVPPICVEDCSADCQPDGIPDECQLGEPAPCTTPDAVITVEILTDNYGSETTWELVEQGTGVVASGGPYASNTLYTVDIDVCSTHCYDFTIYDAYGDGICCSYGNGYYEVYYEGVLVGSGGDFDSSETVAEIGAGCPYDPTPANDCNGNGIPDECDPDCNGNGEPDDCDIAAGTSPDCQPNGVPDECDVDPTDPDGNGEVSEDCQPDGIPDECQLWDEDGRGDRAYCEPCYSNITDDWISEVIFNTINNSTGPEGAPCSFGDYTALSTFVDVGSTHTLTVTVPSGTWTQYAKAWIDWNQDEVFDASESYALGSGASQTFNYDITVPAGALEGCTRMRIQERWLSDPTDPCETYTYGEAEDYTVCVGPPAVCGDGICAPGQEDCCNCPADCGACYCGNGTCDPCVPEDCLNCPADCGACVTIYQWDDGTHENSLGITAGATIGALNHFTAMTAANTIVSIHVAWGSMDNGVPATVYLWSDPDGDGQPHDAQVLASVDVVTANADTDIFNVIPIPPTPLGDPGTSFFVGFLVDSNQYPASMDENGTLAQESWIVGDTAYSIDPNNLGGPYSVPIDQPEAFGFPCNFMIRAEGIPSGAPPNDCNENGVPDECDIPPICDPAVDPCSLDCNGNGTPDECEDELVLCNGIDIKPGSCPNSFNRTSRGVLHTALWGAEFFDIYAIDISSIRLKRADGIGGEVAPHEGPPGPHSKFYDEATPYYGESCHELEGDSVVDLSMYFQSEIVTPVLELDALPPGALVELYCTGTTLGGTPFTTRSDWIRLVPPGAPPGLVAVSSTIPDVWIDVYPLDLQLDGGGWADFERTYPQTSVMFLTAPRIAEGVRFARWEIDGEPQARGQTTLDFEVIGEVMEVKAVFMNPGIGQVEPGVPAGEQTGTQPIGGGMTPQP